MSLGALPSHDGYTWTKSAGLQPGLSSYGVVTPPRNIRPSEADQTYECVVIGAGYTGLIAARDLVKAGKQTISNFVAQRLTTQGKEFFSSKREIESVGEHGVLKSMVSFV